MLSSGYINGVLALFIAAQIVGVIASAVLILSFQAKGNRMFYVMQGGSGLLFAINFLLLGSYTSAVQNVINILRGGVLAAGKKWSNVYTFVLIELLYVASGVLTYQNALSIIVTVAQLAGTAAMWSRNGKVIRIVNFFVTSPSWLANNIYCMSLGGIFAEVFSMISIIVSFLRFGFNGFENENKNASTNKQ